MFMCFSEGKIRGVVAYKILCNGCRAEMPIGLTHYFGLGTQDLAPN